MDETRAITERWLTTVRMDVQVTGPRHAWCWGPGAGQKAHLSYEEWTTLSAGTPVGPPREVVHGLAFGAYVCSWPPTDGRDDQLFVEHELLVAHRSLEAGAIIEIYHPTPENRACFAPGP